MITKTDKIRMRKSILFGLIASLLILGLGFGMMYHLWVTIDYPSDLPGLFSYRAATIGDAVCLPLLIFSLLSYCIYTYDKNNKRHFFCMGIAIVFVVIAVAEQMNWLISKKTLLNWSLPIQHHFNVAGWYHSLFFIGMFGIVGYLLSYLILEIINRTRLFSYFEAVLLFIFAFSGSLFIMLFLSDDYGELASTYVLFAVPVIVITIVVTVLISIKKTKGQTFNTVINTSIAIACLCAYSVALLICEKGVGMVFLSCGGALCGIFAFNYKDLKMTYIVIPIIVVILSLFVIFYRISSNLGTVEVIAVSVVVLILTVIIERMQFGKIYLNNLSLMALLLYFFVSNLAIQQQVDTILDRHVEIVRFIAKLLVNICVIFLLRTQIKNAFEVITNAEENKNLGRIDEERFKKDKGKGGVLVITIILIITLFIMQWICDMMNASKRIVSFGTYSISKESLFIMVLCVSMFVVIIKLRKWNDKVRGLVILPLIGMSLLTDFILIQNINQINMIDEWSTFQYIALGCTVFPCIGVGLLMYHGFVMNLTSLRGMKKEKKIVITALILGLNSVAYAFCTAIVLLEELTWTKLIVAIGGGMIVYILLPALCGMAYRHDYENGKVVPNNSLSGIIQDGISMMLIYIFVICLSYLYIQLSSTSIISSLLDMAFIYIDAMVYALFFMQNNVLHLQRQEKAIEKGSKDDEKLWNELRKCLRCQNILAVISLLPYVAVAMLLLFIKKISKNKKSVPEVIQDIKNDYFI